MAAVELMAGVMCVDLITSSLAQMQMMDNIDCIIYVIWDSSSIDDSLSCLHADVWL